MSLLYNELIRVHILVAAVPVNEPKLFGEYNTLPRGPNRTEPNQTFTSIFLASTELRPTSSGLASYSMVILFASVPMKSITCVYTP